MSRPQVRPNRRPISRPGDLARRYPPTLVEPLEARTLLSAANLWQSRGPGGGGAFFAPSISPYNSGELYVASDMTDVFHTTNLGASWNALDFRRLQGGRLSQVQFTSDPSVLYCLDYTIYPGDASAIPKKSVDGGATWASLPGWSSGGSPRLGDGWSLFADPSNTSRLIVSDYNSFYFSADGGATFSQRYVGAGSNGLLMAGAFFDGQDVYVGTADGLVESHNGGATFALTPVPGIASGQGMYSFAGAKQNGVTRFFCVTYQHNATDDFLYPGVALEGLPPEYIAEYARGVYSFDVGQSSWVDRTSALPAGVQPRLVSMAQNNVSVAYVAGNDANDFPTVGKTANGGGAWSSVLQTTNNQNVATGWAGDKGDRHWDYGGGALGFDVSPADPNTLAFTDLGFTHVSSDGGATWRQAYVTPATQNPAGAPTPQHRAYRGVGLEDTSALWLTWADANTPVAGYTDINGARSTDAGATWAFPTNIGLSGNTVYQISHAAAAGATLYAATSDIHDIYQSTRLTDNFFDTAGDTGNVLQSTDKGATWSVLHDFGHPVVYTALDPANPNRMYASVISSTAGGIYVTNNLNLGTSSTWTKLAAPPRTEGHAYNIVVLTDGTLVATYSARRATISGVEQFTASSGVFVSTNGGTSWLDRTDTGTVAGTGMQYWTKDLTIDPTDASQNTWYAAVRSGYGGKGNGFGGLYRTTDRGVHWSRVFATDSAEGCTITPAGEMYLSTLDSGLWFSASPRAATPTFTQTDYPFRQPERVFVNPFNTSEVWVASFGYGLALGSIDNTPPAVTTSAYTYQSSPNKVSFTFNDDVSASLVAADLVVRNVATSQVIRPTAVSFDPTTQTATFTLPAGLANANYRATLAGTGVADAAGNALPADATLDFYVLAGDANRDRSVDIADFAVLQNHFNLAGTYANGDFNGDGQVNIADFAILQNNFNTSLAAPAAGLVAAAALLASPAPSTARAVALVPTTRTPAAARLPVRSKHVRRIGH